MRSGNQGDAAAFGAFCQQLAIDGGGHGQQELETTAQQRGRIQHGGEIQANFLHAAAGHDRDPLLREVKVELCGIVFAGDGRRRQFGQRMPHERGIHSAIAIELLFERKNDQGLGDVLAQQSYTSLPPRPELRRDVVDDGNVPLLHLTRDAPVECGRIDHDGEVGLPKVSFVDQLVKESPDFGEMAENLGNSDHGKIAGVDDGIAASFTHALAAHAEELQRGIASPQGLDELRAVHFTGSLPGRDQDSHGEHCTVERRASLHMELQSEI